jgi:hypothetical protein
MTRGNDTPPKRHKPASRDERRAAALRENLRRRKAQERGRAASPAAQDKAEPSTDGER